MIGRRRRDSREEEEWKEGECEVHHMSELIFFKNLHQPLAIFPEYVTSGDTKLPFKTATSVGIAFPLLSGSGAAGGTSGSSGDNETKYLRLPGRGAYSCVRARRAVRQLHYTAP